MSEYVQGICCSALICGALGTIGGSGGGVRKMVNGLFLIFVVIAPIRQFQVDQVLELPEQFYRKGESLAREGAASAQDEVKAVICGELEAYILVEAENLGAEVEVVQITLDEETYSPVEVALSGDVGPYQKQMLGLYLTEELGIGKERQLWNGGS